MVGVPLICGSLYARLGPVLFGMDFAPQGALVWMLKIRTRPVWPGEAPSLMAMLEVL